MTNKYFILPVLEKDSLLWNSVVEDFNTIRKNKEGTKMIVKFFAKDDIVPKLLINEKIYTHSEILLELSKSEWDVVN